MRLAYHIAGFFLAAFGVCAEPQRVDFWGEKLSLEDVLYRVEQEFYRGARGLVCEIPSFDDAPSAGPKLMELFNLPERDPLDQEWATKHAIAGCLGIIGYRPAIPSLLAALDREDDWRLVLLSARSLGLLGAETALPRLRELEDGYWYPPVREQAGLAREVIENRASYLPSEIRYVPSRHTGSGRSPESVHLHRLVFFGFGWGGRIPLSDEEVERIVAQRIEDGTYLEPTYRLGPDALRQPQLTFSLYWNPRGRFGRLFRIPDCGLYYAGGVLLGKDDGEFGGDLIFARPLIEPHRLMRDSVAAIHRVGDKVLVFPGQGHGTQNTMVYEVVEGANSMPRLRRWKLLPGGHNGSGWNAVGEFELWFGNGVFIVSNEGEVRMAR